MYLSIQSQALLHLNVTRTHIYSANKYSSHVIFVCYVAGLLTLIFKVEMETTFL